MFDHLHRSDSNTSTFQHPNTFLSCDWGTSSLRLTLAELPSLRVLAAVSSDKGVGATHRAWMDSGGDEGGRADFFRAVLRDAIGRAEDVVRAPLAGVPVVISGMASSSIGLINVPYGTLPFAVDGSDLASHRMPADDGFPHDALIISGIRSQDDVMRGEETQLIGAVQASTTPGRDDLFIFPGTHSKHVLVRDGKAVAFKSFMTGEFFDLLSTKSILAASVARGGSLEDDGMKYFESGIREGFRGNILNAAFHVRTRALFGVHSPEMNYFYLSGLLIGSEIAAGGIEPGWPVTLVGGQSMMDLYKAALYHLGIGSVRMVRGEEAVLRGQSKTMDGLQD